MIFIYINGIKFFVKKNQTVLQVCNLLKIEIPKFCFQENLKIAGNCRMCLVEIENSPKPVASCAMPISENMKIYTDTPLVQKARESVLEFLLINHPLDCPICDQASECDLQDQTMIFGSDKTRFFQLKRGVEDKNCGPFIKTIMTRCIHCTRCVRFANEICNIDDFGTIGRGNKTELSFYKSNLFKSEFSGNLIDLCPVGALTSKPYSFKARSWELKKKESIDILDSIGSNINIDILNNEIVRILPKTNSLINKEWISNKIRFFFDSLKYQRIEYPLLKINNKFQKISWNNALNILNKKLLQKDSSKIEVVCGNLIDLESFYILKKNLNLLGISNIQYLYPKNKQIINKDLTENFFFNNDFNFIKHSDLCLIINSDIRKEGSILNIHLINRLKKGNFKIASIGPKLNYTYPIKHLGNSFDILLNIIQGKHSFCKEIKKSKNPIIIIGENIIKKKNGFFVIEHFKNLSFLKNNNFNIFYSQTSNLNFLEINFNNLNLQKKNIDIYYLYNTNFNIKNLKKNSYIIYQGHHFTENAQKADLIIPSVTFLEKSGYYLNTNGFIQKNRVILNLKTNQKTDKTVFKSIFFLFNLKYSKKKLYTYLDFIELFPYIKNKKIKINCFFKKSQKRIKIINNFLNYNNKNYYISNILEKYSKILMNSITFLKNNSNFNL